MRLTANIVDRLSNAERRFVRLKEKFSVFVRQLEFFSEPRCPVRGVVITASSDGNFCTASFTTVTVGFRLLFTLAPNDVAAGKVVCTLEAPVFTETKPVLGSFTFKPQGLTDFEVAEGADPIDMEQHAIELVLHFVNAALERPEP